MEKNIKISKLDAARRQLETVVRLYFHDGEPVSIHTLTAAAYNIIKDINKKRGGKPMLLKEQSLEYIKPEYVKEFMGKLCEAENFFKHADRDHEATIDFNPIQSELMIMEACSVYGKLTGESPPLLKLFNIWYMSNNPKLFNFPEEYRRMLSVTAAPVVSMGRAAYFKEMLPLIMSSGI